MVLASALSRARLGAALALSLAFAPSLFAQSDQEHALDVQSFDIVWQRIHDTYWDPELGGVDWQGAYDELKPKVEAAESRAEVRRLMNELISRLGKSHFGILPASTAELVQEASKNPSEVAVSKKDGEESEAPKGSGGPGISGLTIRVIDGAALVTAVRPDTPAAASGIRPGWQLTKVGEASVGERVERLLEDLPESSIKALIINRSVAAMLDRSAGTELELTLIDGDQEAVMRTVRTIPAPGQVEKFGNLPAMRVEFVARRLDSEIGYVRLSDWFGLSLIGKFMTAINDFEDTKGMIIDLRGNPGGIGGLAAGFAGFLVEEPTSLGTMITRDSRPNFPILSREPKFRGPIAVLVDGNSASTSEFFAGGMKDIGRARIFGTTTAGAALPSMIEKLPNGDGFQYAIANYVSAGGDELEGIGVIPDEVVVPTRETLLEEGDPVLAAASRWILEQSSSK